MHVLLQPRAHVPAYKVLSALSHEPHHFFFFFLNFDSKDISWGKDDPVLYKLEFFLTDDQYKTNNVLPP